MEAVRRKKKMETIDSHTYDDTFNRKVHFWGRLSIAIAFFMSFSIPFLKG
jgi:hypothetical protein